MFGKNPFRTLLYVVVAMVLAKLCYNLGYGFISTKLGAAPQAAPRSQVYGLPGMSPEDIDAADAPDTSKVQLAPAPGR